jgi:hypothetical protein
VRPVEVTVPGPESGTMRYHLIGWHGFDCPHPCEDGLLSGKHADLAVAALQT